MKGNERAKELSQIIGRRESEESAWKIKAGMGNYVVKGAANGSDVLHGQ